MKLFVWREVLCDYTCGIAVAMAHNVPGARQVLLDAAEDYEKQSLGGNIANAPDDIFDVPAGAYCWGGG